jgi:hypothetical protein
MGATLDTFSMKKPHKFFDVVLENNLEELYDYLLVIEDKFLGQNILNLPDITLNKYPRKHGMMTWLGIEHYNIFSFANEEIYQLQLALRSLTKEASDYYDIDFNKEKYLIRGWFNLDYKSDNGIVSPIKKPEHFHDHSQGFGAPWFHGYYCVNAEPSSTFYQINKDENNIFENINKNNRAILSETGHPHGRDDWFEDKPRITIAYDITPLNKLIGVIPNKWSIL